MEVRLTLRVPKHVYEKLLKLKEEKPHMSMNALIVEAIQNQVEEEDDDNDPETAA